MCGMICMKDNCTVVNVNSLFHGNVIINDGAATIYGQRFCDVTNIETTFEYNNGIDGIVILQDYGTLLNNASTYRYRGHCTFIHHNQ